MPASKSSSPKVDAALKLAINSARPERLRIAMIQICTRSSAATDLARKILLVPEKRKGSMLSEAAAAEEEDEDHEEEEEEGNDKEDDEDEEFNGNSSSEAESISADSDRVVTTIPEKPNKRMRPRYATCENCKEEFDVTDNDNGDCIFHPGKLSIFLLLGLPFLHLRDCNLLTALTCFYSLAQDTSYPCVYLLARLLTFSLPETRRDGS